MLERINSDTSQLFKQILQTKAEHSQCKGDKITKDDASFKV